MDIPKTTKNITLITDTNYYVTTVKQVQNGNEQL